MHPQAFNPPEERCPDCEYTPSGIFAYPCAGHVCVFCGHAAHEDSDESCGHPDPHTGWCECYSTSALLHEAAHCIENPAAYDLKEVCDGLYERAYTLRGSVSHD